MKVLVSDSSILIEFAKRELLDKIVKGGAMKDHRGGEKLYHLAPLFSINVRANC